ncbi:metallophosphoesterase [Filibacter tadaridae]|uniref:Bis(5'-nucleosyl)-tetraphosphatase PrpE [asymmetrical] n=1 Tax=Filibacter tadaridae TaxID=2483811 RepID=A0A3P5XDJ5_9BACL|nr:metallophosphoesterase [Filibacter tadaridae]VDC28923.1 Bis(5'-nucleosyl)-tetraphosphatase PrpE [asymmetrical] [Filibacter tadaridae]
MIEVRQLQLDKTKRSIVISDIHANLMLLKKLLSKLKYTEDDYLFINGDLCEKGPKSLEVVNYVRYLSKKSINVYVTKGNCDVLYRPVFNGIEGIIPYMNRQKNSILNEMLSMHGKSLEDFSDLQALAEFYRHYFHEELEWLESLPVAYETDNFIIIHAGIENIGNWHRTEEAFALSAPAFYENEHQANKTVIVGHWPAVNYRSNKVSSNNPLIDLDKKVISLDGGNQIKIDGQLNALIFENNTYSFTYVDDLLIETTIQKDYMDSSNRIGTVTYPNYDMKIIKQEEYFTLCENSKLGLQQWIKNEYLIVEDGQTRSKNDLSTTFLSVTQAEKVRVVDGDCAGYTLVKRNNGEVGWIPKDCLDS